MSFVFKVPTKKALGEPYYDVGSYHKEITATSAEAQTWFNRGLIWIFSFNHEEACSCFMQAIAYDPDCAMAHWGFTYAAGPNYNRAWHAFEKAELAATVVKCHRVAKLALDKAESAPTRPHEKALIRALQARYPTLEVLNDFSGANKEYADQMRKVYEEHGQDDLDILALFTDALMN